VADIRVVPTWAYLLAIVLAFASGGVIGFNLGVDHEKANQLDAEQESGAREEQRDTDAASTNNAARTQGAAQQVENEDSSHAAQERVKTIFRTVYVAGDCMLPDGVWHEVDQATRAANDSVRAAAGAAAAPVPEG